MATIIWILVTWQNPQHRPQTLVACGSTLLTNGSAYRANIDLAGRRLRSRRMSALREFVAEHGEGALRRVGGRREADRLLAEQDPRASVGELIRALKERS